MRHRYSQYNPRIRHNLYMVQSAGEGVMYGIVDSGSGSTGNAPIAQVSSDSESGSESDAFDNLSGASFAPDGSSSASSFDPDEHTPESRKNPQNSFSSGGDLQSELKTENKYLKFLNDRLGQEIEAAHKIVDKYKRGIEKIKEESIKEIQELKDKLFEVQTKCDMSRENHRREKESNASLRSEIEDLKSLKTSNESNDIELSRLFQETVELRGTIIDLETEINKMKAKAETQEQEYENEIKTLQDAEKIRGQKINKLEGEKTSMQARIASLEETIRKFFVPSNKGQTQGQTGGKKKK